MSMIEEFLTGHCGGAWNKLLANNELSLSCREDVIAAMLETKTTFDKMKQRLVDISEVAMSNAASNMQLKYEITQLQYEFDSSSEVIAQNP